MNVPDGYIIRTMHPDELGLPLEWAFEEGWNPGIHDGPCHYAVDPAGWFVAEDAKGEIVGCIAVTNYDERYAFAGFYIVRPDHRSSGVGTALFDAGVAHAGRRTLGGDGVDAMQDKYQSAYGFSFAWRNIRWQGTALGTASDTLVPASDVPFDLLASYDARHFFCQRRTFLEQWIRQPGATALVSLEGERIQGYGMIRPCRTGHKIGPLFADSPAIAEEIFGALTTGVRGDTFFFDTPEANPSAIALARKNRMEEVFGTARLYRGQIPDLPAEHIYGITSFELG